MISILKLVFAPWLNLLWPSLFGIGMGPTGEEKAMYGQVAGIGRFGTSAGEADISKAQNFWSSILSGDPTKIATVLGPEMSAVNRQAQQQKQSTAQFGTRSGGTTGTMQAIDDATLSSIRSMISTLTGGAATSLGNMGTSLLNTGLSGATSAFGEANIMQQQNAAKWQDIFNSIATIAGIGIGGATGGFTGAVKGGILGQAIGQA